MSLHWGQVLRHDHFLRNTTKWLFLNFYNGECELTPFILGYDCGNRLCYFKHFNPSRPDPGQKENLS